MKMTKTEKRAKWMTDHKAEIEAARTHDHSQCRGNCYNGRTCYNQSDPGYGWIANALRLAGIKPEARNYWSGSNPTPSTSINKGIAQYISDNAPLGLMW